MTRKVRMLTNEGAVHSQVEELKKILARPVLIEVSLNVKDCPSNIEFEANDAEIETIQRELKFNLMIRQGGHWQSCM
jgi:hypothetical protein